MTITNYECNKKLWLELISILEDMLKERICLTEGIRKTVSIWHGLNNPDQLFTLFAPFIGSDDDTDGFPLGEVRSLWQLEGLAKADREREKIETRLKGFIVKATETLLQYAQTHVISL